MAKWRNGEMAKWRKKHCFQSFVDFSHYSWPSGLM